MSSQSGSQPRESSSKAKYNLLVLISPALDVAPGKSSTTKATQLRKLQLRETHLALTNLYKSTCAHTNHKFDAQISPNQEISIADRGHGKLQAVLVSFLMPWPNGGTLSTPVALKTQNYVVMKVIRTFAWPSLHMSADWKTKSDPFLPTTPHRGIPSDFSCSTHAEMRSSV